LNIGLESWRSDRNSRKVGKNPTQEHDDMPVTTSTTTRSPVTYSGYRLGQKPPNFGKRYPAEVLTPAEIHRLIAACPRRGPSGLRNRALIVVLWRAGLRITEALELQPKDVDLDALTITILHGKGDKRRVVGIDPQAGAVITVWLQERAKLGVGPRAPLFCTIARSYNGRGNPIRSAYVRECLKNLARRAGIEKRVHPHGLRHTHAYELANEGTPLHLIQAQLGHTSLATTDRYVRHLAPVLALRAVQARTWAEDAAGAA
jgi:site-specific recombinase XerD